MLIIYVSNPPVRDAIQGAYLVAAVVPACIIGGLSLIFKDIVEGLGCLLGGFAAGMWFMVLKHGGLLISQGGRIGLICGFAGAGFSLSFSQYTRPYGLIVCMSFAGATAIVLGIDCFSRAGLKEFWLYIWSRSTILSPLFTITNRADLNEHLFPLGTNDYPITRGIKVEIALIIIIATVGVMSQMKLWKVIRDRRKRKAEARLQDEEDRDHLEANLGRKVEDNNNRERPQWEAAYGSEEAVDSCTSRVGSSTIHESAGDSKATSLKKPSVSIKEAHSEQEILELNNIVSSSRRSSHPRTTITPRDSEDGPRSKRMAESGARDDARLSSKSSPDIAALPFTVPTAEQVNARSTKAGSVTTFGESHPDFGDSLVHSEHQISRLRDTCDPKNGSWGDEQHEEAVDNRFNAPPLTVPHVDEDRSSVAATIDGLTDAGAASNPKLSRSGTPLPSNDSDTRNEPAAASMLETESSLPFAYVEKAPLGVDDSSTRENPQGESFGDINTDPASACGSNLGPLSSPDHLEEFSQQTIPYSVGYENGRLANLTKQSLPRGESNTVLLYRTNEWAKHQATAEKPNVDDVAPPSEPGVAVNYGTEAAVPVNVNALQRTAFTPQEIAVSKYRSQNSPRPDQAPNMSRSSSAQSSAFVPNSIANVPVNTAVMSSGSVVPPHTHASSSNLLSQPPDKSPLEDPSRGLEKQSSRGGKEISGLENNVATLMGQRQDRLSNRLSTMSFANLMGRSSTAQATTSNVDLASKPRHQVLQQRTTLGPSPIEQPASNTLTAASADEDMTLAQRRELIRSQSQQQGRSTPALRQASTSHTPRGVHSPDVFDSHQPKRGQSVSNAQRESRLASWRASMAQDSVQRSSSLNVSGVCSGGATMSELDMKRNKILEEQRQRTIKEQHKQRQGQALDNAIDARMRSGDMMELHRKKMKAMQSQTK